jgi:hypothetical protein
MFRSYDHLEEKIYFLENYSTDNGSVVLRILVKNMDNFQGFRLKQHYFEYFIQ